MSNQNNALKDLKNLKINDEKYDDDDDDDESDEDYNEINNNDNNTNGRLEQLFSDSGPELIVRAKPKAKQVNQNTQNVPRTILPKPDNKREIIIVTNDQNGKGINNNVNTPQYIFDSTTGTLIQILKNNTNLIPGNLIQIPQQQQQLQHQQHQIENIKQNLQSVVNSPQNDIYSLHSSSSSSSSLLSPNNTNTYNVQSPYQSVPITGNIINSNDIYYCNTESPVSSQFSTSIPNTPRTTVNDPLDEIGDVFPPDIIPNINFHPQQPNIQYQDTVNQNIQDEKDICQAEISLLPNLDCVIKLKKDHGETFIHQLAQSKQIMHIVSTQAFRKLHQRDNITNLNIRLNSYVFMEAVIERAKLDKLDIQTSLLFDIVNVKNNSNITPIVLAVQKDRDDFTRLLIENGANPNIFSIPNMHTALHKACIYGATNSFKILMQYFYLKDEYRTSINQIDFDGNTALMLAIKNHSTTITISNNRHLKINNLTIIKNLVDANANTKILNFDNSSCLHLLFSNTVCSIEDRLRIVKMLRSTLSQLIDIKNNYGKSAWDCWTGMKLIERPEQFIIQAEQVEI